MDMVLILKEKKTELPCYELTTTDLSPTLFPPFVRK